METLASLEWSCLFLSEKKNTRFYALEGKCWSSRQSTADPLDCFEDTAWVSGPISNRIFNQRLQIGRQNDYEATMVPLNQSRLPLFEDSLSSTPKKRTVGPGVAFEILKIPLLSLGLKLSNSKPGCRVSALHFFVKQIPPMAIWHRAYSHKCFFSLLNLGLSLTPVSLLKSYWGVWNCLAKRGNRKTTFFTSIVYVFNWHQRCLMWRFQQSKTTEGSKKVCDYSAWTSLFPCFPRHSKMNCTTGKRTWPERCQNICGL